MKNLMVSSRPDALLLGVDQAAFLCDRLTEPALTAMDGNVYVRPTSTYATGDGAAITWIDAAADGCAARYPSVQSFRNAVPGFERHGQDMESDALGVFIAPDLRRFEPRRPIPGGHTVTMPRAVRRWLGWSEAEAESTVGAYPR